METDKLLTCRVHSLAAGAVLPPSSKSYLTSDVGAFKARSEAPKGGMGLLVLGVISPPLQQQPSRLQLLDTGKNEIASWGS
jgi:hypothetical protein